MPLAESLERWSFWEKRVDELCALCESGRPPEMTEELTSLSEELDSLEQRLLLSKPDDRQGAVVVVQPTQHQKENDHRWALELARMYRFYAERQRLRVDGFLPDDYDNIPLSSRVYTLVLKGPFAYGLLQGETGLHRLLGASEREGASARVDVWPDTEALLQPPIPLEEIRLEAVRGRSYLGARLFNYTSSMIRVTHLPTGLVLYWGETRSQLRNRDWVMKLLRIMIKQRQERSEARLLRTYSMGEQPFVRDHQLGLEDGDPVSVLCGQIDPFVRAYLRRPLEVLRLG